VLLPRRNCSASPPRLPAPSGAAGCPGLLAAPAPRGARRRAGPRGRPRRRRPAPTRSEPAPGPRPRAPERSRPRRSPPGSPGWFPSPAASSVPSSRCRLHARQQRSRYNPGGVGRRPSSNERPWCGSISCTCPGLHRHAVSLEITDGKGPRVRHIPNRTLVPLDPSSKGPRGRGSSGAYLQNVPVLILVVRWRPRAAWWSLIRFRAALTTLVTVERAPLAGRGGLAVASTESDRRRELLGDGVHLRAGALGRPGALQRSASSTSSVKRRVTGTLTAVASSRAKLYEVRRAGQGSARHLFRGFSQNPLDKRVEK
jgi:hypothetical protein